MAMSVLPCTFEFSKGGGTGVAEALGNWGFSNRVCNPGDELRRLKRLFAKMDCLRSNKPALCVKYNCRYDPEAWYLTPSPEEYKPAWTFPINRPLITYSSTSKIQKFADLTTRNIKSYFTDIIPGHSYLHQGTYKWYRRGPECCYQPSCLAPQCPVRNCRSI